MIRTSKQLSSRLLVLIGTFVLLASTENMAQDNLLDVWIGTSTDGIHHLRLDVEKGEMTKPTKAADLSGAGFVELHPNGKVLYATGADDKHGYAVCFEVGEQLKELSRVDTGDGRPSHINVDKSGQLVFTAQYGGGSLSMFEVDKSGKLVKLLQNVEHQGGSGVHGNRQDAPHPHWVGTGPQDDFLYVPDLGMDSVAVYKIDRADSAANTRLHEVQKCQLGPGSGPRHMKFHQDGKHAFVVCEMTLDLATLTVEPESGQLNHLADDSCLPKEMWDDLLNSGAEVRIHPNGKYVYASNRGHDSITVFAFDQATGKLKFVEREAIRGSWPRNFALDPSGKWLLAAGRYSNTVSLFKVDPDSGKLTFTRKVVNVPTPICVCIERAAER